MLKTHHTAVRISTLPRKCTAAAQLHPHASGKRSARTPDALAAPSPHQHAPTLCASLLTHLPHSPALPLPYSQSPPSTATLTVSSSQTHKLLSSCSLTHTPCQRR